MKLELTNNEKIWNDFLLKNNGSFLQSFEWAELQRENGKKTWRFQTKENNEILGQFLIIQEKINAIQKSFLYIPFGPTLRPGLSVEKQQEIIKNFFETIKETAKKENCIFLRIEPYSSLSLFGETASKRIQPQKTLILGLEKPDEQIFKDFHFKARYNTRVARKRGVEVILINKTNSDISQYSNIFFGIMEKTGERQEFGIYPKDYYKNILNIYTDDFKTELFLAKYQEKFIAGYIIVYFGGRAICLHGGMDYQYRETKAPYLLQWRQIQEAKRKGCRDYDFWGIDEKRWPGLTYFKKNFKGKESEYPKGKDLIFKGGWYFIYNFLRKFK